VLFQERVLDAERGKSGFQRAFWMQNAESNALATGTELEATPC
jgi:hypothetical protein